MNDIERIIKEKGMKKSAFADLMHTSKQNVNSLIKNPTFSKIEEIAIALGVTPNDLFGYAPTEQPDMTAEIIVEVKGKKYKLVPIEE